MTTAVVTTEAPLEQAEARPATSSRRRPPRVNRPVGGAGAGVLLWGYAALALVPVWAKWKFSPLRLPLIPLVPFVLVASEVAGLRHAGRYARSSR